MYLILPPPGSTLFPYTTLFRSGQFAVHVRAQAEVRGIGNVRGIDQPGSQHCGTVAVLDTEVRTVPVLEVVANGVVVRDAIPGHVFQSLTPAHTPRAAADDHGELALVMHELHPGRSACDATVPEERPRTFEKYQRLLLFAEGQLLRARRIVEDERMDRAALELRQ